MFLDHLTHRTHKSPFWLWCCYFVLSSSFLASLLLLPLGVKHRSYHIGLWIFTSLSKVWQAIHLSLFVGFSDQMVDLILQVVMWYLSCFSLGLYLRRRRFQSRQPEERDILIPLWSQIILYNCSFWWASFCACSCKNVLWPINITLAFQPDDNREDFRKLLQPDHN